MEKKKLLLVAISAGVFLTLTIGAAMLVFTPKNASPTSIAAANNPAGMIDTGITVPPPSLTQPPIPAAGQEVPASPLDNILSTSTLDPVELVRKPEDVPGLRPSPEGTVRQNEEFYVSGNGRSTETVISVPKPSAVAVPTAPPVQRTPAPARPAAQAQPAQPVQTEIKPAVAVQTRIYDDYWVQTGAFSTVAKAEGVKDTLASKGITSIIENRDVEGSTVFRVRVGPYTSHNEADYWLSLIKSISGFEDSQIRQTQARR